MLTKALWYDLQTNQNIGMLDEKQKGFKISPSPASLPLTPLAVLLQGW